MKTFILIHGSWHSAWNWHKVVPILEKAGHRAIAIDLPGMGRDKTPIQDVTMKTTVEKICALIDSVPGKVILVGHSKNGIMISQAAEYRPDKIEKLVYLAAYLIPNGKTQREYSIQDTEGWLKPYVTQHPDTSSLGLLKNGEWLVGKLYTFSQDVSPYILRWINGVTARSSVHSIYTLGTLPKFASDSCNGVIPDSTGS